VHGVTGGQMREFAQRLRDAAPRPLTEEQILAWADAHHAETAEWPKADSGEVTNAPIETWARIDDALGQGHRGLPGGASLAKLLAEKRGVRNHKGLASLDTDQILAWADAYFEQTGGWPKPISGAIPDSFGETWAGVHAALSQGIRGLSGGSSLAKLLAEHRNVRNIQDLPALTIEKILAWVDAHRERTGEWPTQTSGVIPGGQGQTWRGVQIALLKGRRGLPGGSTIARLLSEERAVQHLREGNTLTEEQILIWADQHFDQNGRWPSLDTGSVLSDQQITWRIIEDALKRGHRGLPGGSSLAQLLAERRGTRNRSALPRLTVERVLSWADAYFARTGQWPNRDSGSVDGAAGETWNKLNTALHKGHRGLPEGSSLAHLLAEHRGKRSIGNLPPLTVPQVLSWANEHFNRTGRWPNRDSGAVDDIPGEKWMSVENALRLGLRGLPGGSSLARLAKDQRSNLET